MNFKLLLLCFMLLKFMVDEAEVLTIKVYHISS